MLGDSESASKIRRILALDDNKELYFSNWRVI